MDIELKCTLGLMYRKSLLFSINGFDSIASVQIPWENGKEKGHSENDQPVPPYPSGISNLTCPWAFAKATTTTIEFSQCCTFKKVQDFKIQVLLQKCFLSYVIFAFCICYLVGSSYLKNHNTHTKRNKTNFAKTLWSFWAYFWIW